MAKKRPRASRMEEVTDLQSEPTPAKKLDLVGGLIFVTFLALLVGIVLSQAALKKYFDAGFLGSS